MYNIVKEITYNKAMGKKTIMYNMVWRIHVIIIIVIITYTVWDNPMNE